MSDGSLSVEEILRHGDRALILAQRLTELIARAPDIEQDMALANLGLDLLGQARALYTLAGEREGLGRSEDDFAYLRDATEFDSPALVEQPNGDFALTVVRQFLHDAFAIELWRALTQVDDAAIAALAAKVIKETTYHLRYSRGWLVRLGDGTPESHQRMTAGVDTLWPFVDDLFDFESISTPPDALRVCFDHRVAEAFREATLQIPDDRAAVSPTEAGPSEALVELLAEMQGLHRAHPGASW